MTDEKDDEPKKEEEEPEDLVDALQESIQQDGTRGNDETFAVLPGKGAVLFIINSLPGREGKVLAMQLPPQMAVQLGQALVNAAFITQEAGEELVEKEEEKKVTWH